MLPQLQDRDHTHVDIDKDGVHEDTVVHDKVIEAMEGPRGIIAASNGIVFDLAGGCVGCIKVYPEAGDEFVITNHHSVRHLHHVTPVVVAALHSHSETYFHAVSELLPRLYLIMDYIQNTFAQYINDPNNLILSARPHYALLNSMNEMMEWGFVPTARSGPHNHWHGTFKQPRNRGVVEASEHIIAGPCVHKDWHKLLKRARKCAASQLISYTANNKGKATCAIENLPEKYIILIHRESDRQRSLLNHTILQSFVGKYFDVPLIIPNLKYGCHLQDNVIYFRKAIGFISPHGAAFTNVNFIGGRASILQFVPPKPHPFVGPSTSYGNQARDLGHKYMEIQTATTKEPRWDMMFDIGQLLEKICQPNNPGSKVNSMFDIWMPKKELHDACSSREGMGGVVSNVLPSSF